MSKAPRGFVPYCATYHCAGDCGLPHNQDERVQQFTDAKTSAQRQAEFSARQKKAGLVKVHGLWTHPDDQPAIKEFAAKLARKRARESRRASTNQETA